MPKLTVLEMSENVSSEIGDEYKPKFDQRKITFKYGQDENSESEETKLNDGN